MRILLLSDINSTHTRKWAAGIASRGHVTGLFTISNPVTDWYSSRNIVVFNSAHGNINTSSVFSILHYRKAAQELNKVIQKFQPDVVHAHYATSYGLIGRWSDFHPFFLSVWGSDLLVFPKKSMLHAGILKKNLRSADRIFSTSKVLMNAVKELTGLDSVIVPFGVDPEKFKPGKGMRVFRDEAIVIGTIKTLEKNYGIDVLINSFELVKNKFPSTDLRLVIGGDGSQRAALELMVAEKRLSDYVVFTGKIPAEEVADYHNAIDIFANLSEYESFGVSVLEASACGKPVVATDTGGLKEVVINGKTGILVPTGDVEETANAFGKLVADSRLRQSMGAEGRQFVMNTYNWNECLDKMIVEYESVKAIPGK